MYSLRSEAHAQAGQVAVAEWEEGHEHDVPSVMNKHDRQVVPGLYVAQNEERDEYDAEQH